MSTLPVTNFDCNIACLIGEFIREVKEYTSDKEAKFTPKLKGYEINIEDENDSLFISIKYPENMFFKAFTVKAIKSDGTKQKYKFKSKDEIKSIVEAIFSL